MKKTIQTKRRANNGFRKLHARTTTRKRKLRATTAVADPHLDLESDIPNGGVGRALIVILVIHVVAIALIYLHSTFIGTDAEETVVEQPPAAGEVSAKLTVAGGPVVGSAAVTAQADTSGVQVAHTGLPATQMVAPPAEPAIDYATGRYIVVSGDNYARIAQNKNVDETALRALNDNRPLRAGVVLDLPAQLSPRPVSVAQAPPARMPQTPEVAAAPVHVEPQHARAVVVDEDPAPRAIVVGPAGSSAGAGTTVVDSGKRYTVKSGDTVWRIASRYKVSRENLLAINGITDPRKLFAGREIKIPVQ
ncbi:LysM peptidoglycan-binding domain-containing protein [Verrucomicrobiaceae bacterium N1E253]|uniref:LysM peptidoglycan-binding domain-containing protein n=1 Tax=Oceaniferula marina TaxID=2748318 RepID=A0A851GN79_9BACT|nr:LysM peptidoglycan-binding domain-containing protein [Oceaniferula marina]NWK56290.1 LysM peptidoglycan-binding domain-containing protein [Oceaniferula marina]